MIIIKQENGNKGQNVDEGAVEEKVIFSHKNLLRQLEMSLLLHNEVFLQMFSSTFCELS
jgi:hypothetical protein